MSTPFPGLLSPFHACLTFFLSFVSPGWFDVLIRTTAALLLLLLLLC